MRKRLLLLALGLTVALAVSSVVAPTNVSAYTINKDGTIKYIEGVSSEGIAKLNEIAIESDLEMLDDIVERSYNNNFDIKSYVIKSTDKWLDSTYWNNYLRSRGDTYISASFTRNNIVYDEGTGYYYHSVKVEALPAWEVQGGYFDYTTRKITLWNDYIDEIRGIEKSMGYTEGGNLCDYELLWGVYHWMADNIEYGTQGTKTKGQSAITAALEPHRAQCAGYARLLNRFCHDFGIDSYWVSIPSMPHAVNFVKLNNEYYHADFNRAILNVNDNYYNKHLKTSPYGFDRLYALKNENINNLEYYSEYKSIIHYNSNFVNSESLTPIMTEEFSSIKENGYFNQPGPAAEYKAEIKDMFVYDDTETCGHCGKRHYFPYDKETSTVPVKEYPIIEHSYSFEGTEDGMDWYGNYTQGAFTIYCDGKADYTEINEVETTTEYTTVEPTTEEEVPTPPTRPIETTTSEEETPSIVVPTKPVETTKKVEVPVTTPKQTTTTQKETTTKKVVETTTKVKTPKKAKISLKKAKKNSLKVKLTSTNAVKFKIQIVSKAKYNKKNKKGKKLKWTKAKTIKNVKVSKKGYYTIKGLKKNTKYYIRVKGVNFKNVASKKWSTTLKKSTTKK